MLYKNALLLAHLSGEEGGNYIAENKSKLSKEALSELRKVADFNKDFEAFRKASEKIQKYLREHSLDTKGVNTAFVKKYFADQPDVVKAFEWRDSIQIWICHLADIFSTRHPNLEPSQTKGEPGYEATMAFPKEYLQFLIVDIENELKLKGLSFFKRPTINVVFKGEISRKETFDALNKALDEGFDLSKALKEGLIFGGEDGYTVFRPEDFADSEDGSTIVRLSQAEWEFAFVLERRFCDWLAEYFASATANSVAIIKGKIRLLENKIAISNDPDEIRECLKSIRALERRLTEGN